MARYIDADKLLKELRDEIDFEAPLRTDEPKAMFNMGLRRAIIDVKNAPTEDVVPKSEVEVLQNELVIWKQNRFNLYQRLELYKETRAKVAREIFEEIELLMKIYTFPVVKMGVIEIVKEPFWCIEPNDFDKLKNKYTKGEHDEQI